MSEARMLHPAILAPLLRRLPAKDLARFGKCSKDCQKEAENPSLWTELLQDDFKDFNYTQNFGNGERFGVDSLQKLYAKNMAQYDCKLCQNRIWVCRRPCQFSTNKDALRRCSCIIKRSFGKYPLKVADFCEARVQDSFTHWPGFEPARKLLRENFDVSFVKLSNLDAEELDNVDLLILNMTSAHQNLSQEERRVLVAFIDAGGSAILNVFSQWSNSGDFGRNFANPLGIGVTQGASFGRHKAYKLADEAMALDLLHGPFGKCVDFENIGETEYDTRELPRCEALEVVRLAKNLSLFPNLIHNRHGLGLYCVPSEKNHVGGQILVCSNFHWFCAPGYWNGGLIYEADNANLFLNFAASAAKRLFD